jgi:hypothetical protein
MHANGEGASVGDALFYSYWPRWDKYSYNHATETDPSPA